MLDVPLGKEIALQLKQELIEAGTLPAAAVAIQAIAFDRTAITNWKVTWHQDLMFPLALPATSPDYTLGCLKEGIPFARPPRKVLEQLLAVRLHLDDCDMTNGSLRVVPGSHRLGIIPVAP